MKRLMKSLQASLALAATVLALGTASATSQAADAQPEKITQRTGWDFREMGLIPIQSGGRMKPLDTFARELAVFETGSKKFEGWDPVDLMASWLTFPQSWQETPFLQIAREDVRRELNLDEKRTRFSPKELMTSPVLGQYAQLSNVGDLAQPPMEANKGPRQDQRAQERNRVLERLGVFRNVVSGGAWLVVPAEAPAPWKSLAMEEGQVPGHELSDGIKRKFLLMFQAYMNGNQEAFQKAAAEARAAVESSVPGWNESYASRMRAEYLYNRFHPFMWAWIALLIAALTWAFALALPAKDPAAPKKAGWLTKAALAFTACGWLLCVFGVALRCYVAGRPPVTNMYESVIWVSIGTVFFASILYWIQRQGVVLLVACVVATLCLIAADSAPAVMDPSIHPLVPVLRSNYWLTVHVLTITLGYAAFALTFGLGNATLIQYLRIAIRKLKAEPQAKTVTATGLTPRSNLASLNQKVMNLNLLSYRAMGFGTVLLAAGTILGGVWADYSWGRFWGWDPKEVWALIALLCYLAILHGRFTNWIGQFGFAVWTVVAFLSVVMAWYGVNFVLGVGLHSYGFSTGGRGAMAAFTLIELSFVGIVAFMHQKAKAKSQISANVVSTPA